MSATIKLVPVESIRPARFNPSGRTEERRLKYLKSSMEEHGFLEAFPIVVDGEGVICDGHRRYRVAVMLGIGKVPVVTVNSGLEADTVWSVAATGESPTASEVLQAYGEGLKVLPDKNKNSVMLLQAVFGGKRQLKEFLKKGKFSPAIYHQGKRIANYCGRGDDNEFIARAIVWMAEKKMQRNCRFALESEADPEVIVSAIEENRPLSIVANIA